VPGSYEQEAGPPRQRTVGVGHGASSSSCAAPVVVGAANGGAGDARATLRDPADRVAASVPGDVRARARLLAPPAIVI
jgi:hypothetical protein